ncbi:MAG: hypothetical protein PHI58_05620, partial [Candidatus Omnitrophica bacterium]|nr:hypothetical protein [Candidatus Omnitrophota bacterium]
QIYRFRRTSDSPAKFEYMPPPLLKDEGYKKLCGLACDSKGRIYVVDGITGDVRRYLADFKPDPDWKFQATRPDGGPFLDKAEGIVVDESAGTLFLSSDWDGMIRAFDLETGKWKGKSIGRGADTLTANPLGRSVFSMSVEGLAIMDGHLFAVDEGEISASKNFHGHLLVFDMKSPVLYETGAENCRERMGLGIVDGLVGAFGAYQSPDGVAVFPGDAKHPEPIIAVANQGAYLVEIYKWEDIRREIAKAQEKGKG